MGDGTPPIEQPAYDPLRTTNNINNTQTQPLQNETPAVPASRAAPQQSDIHSKEDRGKAFRQVVAAFIANLGTINTGLVFGFSAVVIPQLQQEDSIIPIDENQASWIGK